jgi:hypothetical protein
VPSVVSDNCKSLGGTSGEPKGPCQPCGGFYVLYDEAQEQADLAAKEDEESGKTKKNANNNKSNKAEWR